MACLITANRGAPNVYTLEYIGFRHGRNFVVYAELHDFQDLEPSEFGEGADLHCEAERLDGEKQGWWSELWNGRIPPYSERTTHSLQLSWIAKLDPGRWRVLLKVNGREVASREIEISGAVQ